MRLQQIGKRLQTPLPGNCGTRATFGAVRQVEILERSRIPARLDPPLQFGRQGSLVFDRFENGSFAGFELSQPLQLLLDSGDLHLVERTGSLLAVAADKGDRSSLA